HYQLETGMLRPGDPADFVVASGADPFQVTATYIDGKPVFREGMVEAGNPEVVPLNAFQAKPIKSADLEIRGTEGLYRVIRAYDGELLTDSGTIYLTVNDGVVQNNIEKDVLKIVVLNRYADARPALGWISGFGLKTGAMASSIAHDSHNIIAVGTSDEEIAAAINQIICHRGGVVATEQGAAEVLPLPVAGLMSTEDAETVGTRYAEISEWVKKMGSPLQAPFMALSFMALLVIPHLKIGDRGLFNCDTFSFTELKAD
ncbi:MAG: adenine deaminase C-terminal domain-containing protein, partial [Bacteroidales bacterium]|nr:adenine deaminase C-terminal domain-containing protein [Bacteroidales bacterium]